MKTAENRKIVNMAALKGATQGLVAKEMRMKRMQMTRIAHQLRRIPI